MSLKKVKKHCCLKISRVQNKKAVSNLFGTLDRGKFIFRNSIDVVKDLIDFKLNPLNALKNPFKSFFTLLNGIYSIPKKVVLPKSFKEIKIEELPLIKCWKEDGGAFITFASSIFRRHR